ncbi:hypothetical protein [Nocardia rhizosphaerihabitans]|uniref:Uncharacterized protein n=1 Tax=Nocardia rhizosphaerihabitans TaxID=1691570 RepID=A0ABQ2KDV0_9NOCA|nr:hypothetical protein [Nocardia rhizosphaerihabitans]GGN78333.1 hypothetical protein GCM10011610_25730 [Nocardia rhizosphaerihabitans]
MAQYFKAVFLDADTGAVTGSLRPGISFKLIEHAWQGSWFVDDVSRILTTPTRMVWAGDYADAEPGYDPNGEVPNNLYHLADKLATTPVPDTDVGGYLVNHDRRLYLRTDHLTAEDQIHPLPALTIENHQGDVEDPDGLVGTSARQLISVNDTPPDGYTEIDFTPWF